MLLELLHFNESIVDNDIRVIIFLNTVIVAHSESAGGLRPALSCDRTHGLWIRAHFNFFVDYLWAIRARYLIDFDVPKLCCA